MFMGLECKSIHSFHTLEIKILQTALKSVTEVKRVIGWNR